jgi:photosystem II stability/assembly factor-like uncharacterized protein
MLNGQLGPGGNFFSYDRGITWKPAGIYPASVSSLALSPVYNSDPSLWAGLGAGQGRTYRSTNGGSTWLGQSVYDHNRIAFNSMAAAHQSGGGYLVFGTTQLGASFAGVYLSSDSGTTFYLVPGSPQYGNVVAVSPGFASDQTVWVGAYYGLFYSTNSGSNWSLFPGDLPANNVTGLAVSPAYLTDHTMFAVVAGISSTQVYRTVNSGTNWTQLSLPGGAIPVKVSISPAYATDQTVWVSSQANGVFRSGTKGDSWQSPTTVLSGCGEVQPNGSGLGRLLWAACSGSLYRSSDEGNTWTQDGPAGVGVTVVSAFPDDATVFVGTTANGVYRRVPNYSVMLALVMK